MSTENDTQDVVMVNGRRLTEAQLSRRRFNLGLLASGAFAALAGTARFGGALAQDATPSASPAASPVAEYAGPLATDQTVTLPTQEPTTMDPGVSYGDYELDIIYQIFEGLVGIDTKTGDVIPRIAESWTINADASVFTFKIRQGVTWSDGVAINASDFVYSWQRILDPNLASQYIPALYPIKNAEKIANADPSVTINDLGVVATDDYTLTVTLEGPTTYFPLLASTFTFMAVPKHVIDKNGAKWVEASNIVCNGPYKMTEWNHDQDIVVELNDAYYGDKPTVTKATYRLFTDVQSQTFVSFQNNELDYCAPQGADLETAQADTSGDLNTITFESSNTYFVVCDTSNSPTDKVEVRQALYKSIDRETLAKSVLKNQYLPALTLLPPSIPGNNPASAMDESIAEAKQLLATAGVDPSSVTLELTFINSQFYTTVVQYLQAGWQQSLGIKIKLNPIDNNSYSDWRAARETTPFGIYTGSWGSDFADASNWFNQNFTHAADHYRNHWNDPDFDALVAKADVDTNAAERIKEYSQAEVIIVQQAPIIPILHGITVVISKPWLKDVFLQPVGPADTLHVRDLKVAPH